MLECSQARTALTVIFALMSSLIWRERGNTGDPLARLTGGTDDLRRRAQRRDAWSIYRNHRFRTCRACWRFHRLRPNVEERKMAPKSPASHRARPPVRAHRREHVSRFMKSTRSTDDGNHFPLGDRSFVKRALDRLFRYEAMSGAGTCPVYLERWTLGLAFGCGMYLHRFQHFGRLPPPQR